MILLEVVPLWSIAKIQKQNKKAGIRSPICIRQDARFDSFTVLKGTDELLQFIKKKESKVDKDGLLIIQIALGQKQSDDVVPAPTYFDRQDSGSTAATFRVGSPLKKLQSTGAQKSASSNSMKKNRADLKKIFIDFYKNSPLYKKKLCREHFQCFVAKFGNARSDSKEKGRIEYEPFTKRQKSLVGTPKLMMGRHIKLLMKEGDEDDPSKKGDEFIMPWFGDEAEEAYLDITAGEECISIDSDRGVYVSTKIKRKNCSAGSSSLKSIDGVQDYISKLEPDTPLQSIAWEGHQPPTTNTYNVILTGTWPSAVTNHLTMDESLAHINTSSMDEIYDLFLLRRNNQYLQEAETLIESMVTEQNKSKGTDTNASIFTGSMKDLATAKRNAILKKVYISSAKKKFIQAARAEGGIDMIIINEREKNEKGKFEEWGGVVFETYYKLDLSIYG